MVGTYIVEDVAELPVVSELFFHWMELSHFWMVASIQVCSDRAQAVDSQADKAQKMA